MVVPNVKTFTHAQSARRTGRERGAGVLTGIAIGDDRRRSEHDARMAATARAFRSGLAAPALLSGRVGDCCDDDAEVGVKSGVAFVAQVYTAVVRGSVPAWMSRVWCSVEWVAAFRP